MDASDLWPDVPAADFAAARRGIVEAVARLLCESRRPERSPALDGATPRAVSVAAFASGTGAWLAHAVETGRLETTAEIAATLCHHLDHGRLRAERLSRELRRVLDALGERDIAAIVLKGGHTAAVYFPEPGTRPTADIDLLVRPGHFAAAERLLRDLGFTSGTDLGLPDRREWYGPGVSRTPVSLDIAHVDSPWSIDLHAALDREFPLGLRAHLRPPDPRECPTIATPAGRLRVLPQPHLLHHLAVHTSAHFGMGPLLRFIEIVLVVRRDMRTPAAWSEFLGLLGETRGHRFVYPAVAGAARLAPEGIPHDVVATIAEHTPWPLRYAMARRGPGEIQRLHRPSPLANLMWVGSMGELRRVARSAMWPYSARGGAALHEGASVHRWRWRALLRRFSSRA